MRKAEEFKETAEKTKRLFSKFENNYVEERHQEEDTEFLIVPGRETIIQRLRGTLQKTHMSLDVVTSRRRFSSAFIEFAEDYEKALKRGVRIRIASEKHEPEREALDIVHRLTDKWKMLEVRFFPYPLEAILSIYDNKQAFVTLSKTANLKNTSALWSKNATFIALSQNYFEHTWRTSAIDYNPVTPFCVGCPGGSFGTCRTERNHGLCAPDYLQQERKKERMG